MKPYITIQIVLIFLFSISSFSQEKEIVLDTIQPNQVVITNDTIVQRDSIKNIVVDINPILTPKKIKQNIQLQSNKISRIPLKFDKFWSKKNMLGLDVSQIAFVNWNAGGNSSVAGLVKGLFTRKRSDINSEWQNELSFRYGLNKQEKEDLRKSDDEVRLTSSFGYRKDTLSNWYYSAKFNFNTQFSNGYRYPDNTKPISRAFAPAYTFLGIGANYLLKKNKFDAYISPLTLKSTFVFDQTLANQGAFGVEKAVYDTEGNILTQGKNTRTEFGFLVTNYYKSEVMKNITMENRLSLYSDYIHNFGNIDVEWRLQFDLVVNQYIKTNIGLHMIYDDDVKTSEKVNGETVIKGARLQLRESIGIGLVYNF
jgi:hypothetical protein